jgi:hypothetical protein
MARGASIEYNIQPRRDKDRLEALKMGNNHDVCSKFDLVDPSQLNIVSNVEPRE